MKIKYILFVSILLFPLVGKAQQDALFSQYMFNKLVINPGYAGTRGALSAVIVGRYQWVNLDGSPKTASVSVHSPLRNEKMGVGLYIYNDLLGPLQDAGFMGNYAYRVQVGKGLMSFGLQFGLRYNHIDWTKVNFYDSHDFVYDASTKKEIQPDVNFGIYYYTDNYFVGLSSKHLLEKQFSVIEVDGESLYATFLRHFYGMAGVAIPLGDERLIFKPSTLVKYVKNASLQVDINASLLINQIFWLGISYRTKRAAVFIAEMNINSKLRIGYSYDWYLNELQNHNMGSHEIMIGYDFMIRNTRVRTPRYF